ncbi:MAG: zinc-ribbon domain-containing protein [Gemmataceae bacterium]|nr:zinc-ribbon domain-containing protein [Gemmataceae bacterium]
MPIPVACPGCSARLNAPDVAAGKRVKCPKCQTLIPVPAASDEEVDEPTARPSARRPRDEGDDDRPRRRPRDDEDDADDRPRPKRRRAAAGSGGVPVWAWAVGGVGLLAAAGVVLWLTVGGKGGEVRPLDATAPKPGDGAVGVDRAERKELKPGEKVEGGRSVGLPTVEPGPDGWAKVDDPVHGVRVELPGRAFSVAMAANDRKAAADRGYNQAEWSAMMDRAEGKAEVLMYRRTTPDPYPSDPAGLWDAFDKTQLRSTRLDTTPPTTAPATVDGRPAAEVRYRGVTFKERSARAGLGAADEPDDPTDVPDSTVIRVVADRRWLYAVRLTFHARKPDEAVMKRVFESVKLSPPDGG